MSESIQWFQYKHGVVGESQRVVHCARSVDSERLRSWCSRDFDPSAVEETAEPGQTPGAGQVKPGAPCIPCLFLVTAATTSNGDAAQLPASEALPDEPE